jgi:pimeloyl-ACP methyl ester carboxylesterase
MVPYLLGGGKVAKAAYEKFSSHDGTSIAYRVSGEGQPVVLVHGYTVTSTVNFATHYSDDGSGRLAEADGPTVESALVDAGCEVTMLDLRGHGRSDRPNDAGRYSMQRFADDVRALVSHVGIGQAALVGYSFGASISCHLLADSWVSRAALCGMPSDNVEGEDPEFYTDRSILAECFLHDRWDDHPDYKVMREFARLDASGPDFTALGLVAAHALRPIPVAILASASLPVLVLNGGADTGAANDHDLSRFIPGARRVVAGTGHHGNAPSDPKFQAEIVRFVRERVPPPL